MLLLHAYIFERNRERERELIILTMMLALLFNIHNEIIIMVKIEIA
jgi:hypothetical protein